MAAVCSAVTLLMSGPVHADARLIRISVGETVADTAPQSVLSQSVLSQADATPLDPAPLVAEPLVPTFETIGSGMASYYGKELAGARTASGERFNPAGLTAAHRTLPMGSKVRVTNDATGQSVVVTINDRGPFHGNRVIDLSEAAARQVGLTRAGSGRVSLALAAK